MQAILDFFVGIFEVISSLIQFVIDFIGDLVYVVQLTAQFVSNIPNYFAWMPAAIVSIIVSIFAVVVIYKVMGREG